MYNYCINVSKILLASWTVILSNFLYCYGSSQDSLKYRFEVGLRGRWQTGNTDQFVINPNASIYLDHPTYSLELAASYQRLRVNDFTVISDYWSNALYSYQPSKRLFPIAAVYHGFAKSYRIDRSLVGGLGAGTNVLNKSARKYLKLHAFMGYTNIEFDEANGQSSAMWGTFAKSEFPLGQLGVSMVWRLHTYHSLSDNNFWGANNIFQLNYLLSKSFTANINHTTIFNNTVENMIEKTNTLMMFGLIYTINN